MRRFRDRHYRIIADGIRLASSDPRCEPQTLRVVVAALVRVLKNDGGLFKPEWFERLCIDTIHTSTRTKGSTNGKAHSTR